MSSSNHLGGNKAAFTSAWLGLLMAAVGTGCTERVPMGPPNSGSDCVGEGERVCGGSCVNVLSDPSNCGSCGFVCTSGSCVAGVCEGETIFSCTDTTYRDRYTPGYTEPRNPEVDSLIASMTVSQKADQMRGVNSGAASAPNWNDIQRTRDVDVSGLTIRGYYFRDGPRGVNLEARQHNRARGEDYATAFPVPMAQGASFDLDLVYRMGEAMGDETVASQNTMLLIPCMNILRHPWWGRAQETFGEDTWHVGRIASAVTAGLQTHVAACAKHYAGNNIEEDRFNENAAMDEQTLRETYTGHFEMVVRDGGTACIMAAYNSINGTKCTQNGHLLREILKGDMGFRGFVLTDWWAMPPGQTIGSDTSALADNARGALEAGLDCEVPWDMNYGQLESIVAGDERYGAMVTEGATRILEQKLRFNAHDANGPYGPRSTVTRLSSTGSIAGNEPHLELAQEAAAKSMVLLKNEGRALPIAAGSTVAVLGGEAEYMVLSDCGYNPSTCPRQIVNFATDIRTGDRGSSRVKSNPAQVSAPLDGITAAAARHGATVVSDAATADYIVVVVGLTAQDEGEEYTGASDRNSFALDAKNTGNQNQLVQDAAETASQRGVPLVVVLVGGSVIAMPWLNSVDAVVMSWYPGQMGGAALGDLLFGDENFGGKLPITWATEGWTTFDEGQTTSMSYYVGYKWFDVNGLTPIFPFGHGLSYSSFQYSNIRVDPADCGAVSQGAVIGVQVDITNSSDVAGEEVAFLFVSWPNTTRVAAVAASGSKVPIKELKGFVRTDPIAPGATATVTIPLRIADLKYWNMASSAWEVESGQVDIMVGPSSVDLPLTTSVTVQ